MKLNRFAKFAWFVLAFNLAVILWGAFVRASGSGAGCGSHWPLCNGEVVPQSYTIEKVIEYTHRATSGLALILIVAMAVYAFLAFPRGHRVRYGSVLSLAFILTEALVGAGLVLLGLVAQNSSMTRASLMSFHLVNTFILLAAMTVTAWWASSGAAVRLRNQGALLWIFGAGLVATLLLGVSGAVTALGDTLFPSSSVTEGLSQDISSTAHILIRLRLLHPTLAVSVGIGLMVLAFLTRQYRRNVAAKRLSLALPSIIALQLLAGLANVFLLAPVWMQLVHLFLADILWIVLVLMMAAALSENEQEAGEQVWVADATVAH
jgi:heme A synthase